jgi:hypothetical protein
MAGLAPVPGALPGDGRRSAGGAGRNGLLLRVPVLAEGVGRFKIEPQGLAPLVELLVHGVGGAARIRQE